MIAALFAFAAPFLVQSPHMAALTSQRMVVAAQQEQTEERPARAGRRGGRRGESTEVRIYRMKYADAIDVASTVSSVCRLGVIPDERTNSIIVQATAGQLEQVEEVVSKIDVAVDEEPIESDMTIVKIHHRSARDVANQLMESLRHDRLRIVADQTRGNVLLNGDSDQLNKARDIIDQVDTPAASVVLEFSFFKASLEGKASPSKIPSHLKEVAKSLERFGAVELLGQFTTTTVEGDKFEVSGIVSSLVQGEVQGTVASAPEGGSVRLIFEAGMSMMNQPSRPKDDAGKQRRMIPPSFSLRTTVTTERGHFVVLGSAPGGWNPGESAILVLHVRE